MESEDQTRDRAKRLYQFVRGLIELRHVPVRRYTKEDTIALDDLPKKPDCSFIARSDFADEDNERWLEVRCPKFESYPEPPPILMDWLEPSELADASQDMPNLLTGIRLDPDADLDEADTTDDEGYLGAKTDDAQVPPDEVKEIWERYIEDQWWPWKERTAPKFRAKKLYDDLFRMYQRQEQLGETYEIVVGFGLLSWRPTSAIEIQRYLVTTELSVEFDSRRQVISLQPTAEGTRLRLEEDMLDPTQRPSDDIRKRVAAELESLEADLWNSDQLHNVLQEYCNSLASDAQYDQGNFAPKSISESPVVSYAPSIVLRRRGSEGLLGLVDSIIDAIDSGAEIPITVQQQVAVVEKRERGKADGSETLDIDDEVYFPLPANREQRKIVDHLRQTGGVIVEGPPGTGKSQTIANLVCHLLATGKRVLVTSHTARALQVLRDKIPDEIRPLCVQALSNDAKGMDALEFSVKGITDRHITWNSEDSRGEIDRIVKELTAARERLQAALHELRSIREAEVFRHEGIAGQYSGTLAQIARQLRTDQDRIGLIHDAIETSADPPFSQSEFRELLNVMRTKPKALETALAAEPPDPNSFCSAQQFRLIVTEIADLERALESATDDVSEELVTRIKGGAPEVLVGSCSACERRLRYPNRTGKVTCPDCGATFEHCGSEVQRAAILESIRDFAADLRALRTVRAEQWLEQAITDIFTNRDRKWKGLLEDTQARINSMKALSPLALDARLSGHESEHPDTLRHKAATLSAYLERRAGKGIGFRPLMPKNVKEALAVLEKVRIDGEPCVDLTVLETLKQWAEACRLFELVDQEWAVHGDLPKGSMRSRIKEYEDACEPIAELFELLEKAAVLTKSLRTLISDGGPAWHREEELQSYLRALAAVNLDEKLRAKEAEFAAWSIVASQAVDLVHESHIRDQLRSAIASKDYDAYSHCLDSVAESRQIWEQECVASKVMRLLEKDLPTLCDDVKASPTDQRWNLLLDNWDSVWAWTKARSWVQSMVSPEADRRASSRVRDESARIQDLLAKLASAKAWGYCFERLTERQRVHLQAWEKAVKRIGKGTGKYANQHRRAARENIAHCQPAIPAWVMPLYRVAESIRPGESRFDVAIIDEASQSGPEALALLFLAEKIVVVGDDKQISPDPFTRVEDVNRLRKEFVSDLPANDALSPENSFFDLGKIRYPARVRLVEHFRCMPEIIQFSNDLCYKSEPLLPLRQFGAGRLEPVVQACYVENASTKGKTQKTNAKEAVAIARRIADIIKDPRYAGKSLGVISLLGNRQARVIENEIRSIVDARELYARSLICGEAYAFQGDERDVMFLSLVSAPGAETRIGVLGKASDERRFNVAMSRAKDQVWLFHSATLNDLSPNDLRTRLLRYCMNPTRKIESVSGIDIHELRNQARTATRSIDKAPGVFESWFEVDVFLRIAERGFLVVPQYEALGKFIDMAVVGQKAKLAVECDGEYWHGADAWEKDSARQRDLERCEWPFVRIRESAFALDPESALNPLWEALAKQGIRPQGEPEPDHAPVMEFEEVPGESAGVEPTLSTVTSAHSSRIDEGQDSSLPGYEEWQPIAVPDPGSGATRESIIQAMVDIVQVEGPVSWRRVLDRYRLGLELGRLKGPRREALVSAARVAVRTGRLTEANELDSQEWLDAFVRVAGSDEVRLRQRGQRELRDVPPSEIAEAIRAKRLVTARNEMAELMRESGQEDSSEEWAFRMILSWYGLRRLTKGSDGGGGTVAHLRRAWELTSEAQIV